MNRDLEQSRERFERSLDELRGAIHDEIGWWPRAKKWALPIAAAAVGAVFGLAVRRALPGSRQRRLR